MKRDLTRRRLAVQADPKSLQRILASLLSNASKYTKDGGMITLGAVGYVTSAMVRVVGDYLMQWRLRELAMGGR